MGMPLTRPCMFPDVYISNNDGYFKMKLFVWVVFYGISILVGYLMHDQYINPENFRNVFLF